MDNVNVLGKVLNEMKALRDILDWKDLALQLIYVRWIEDLERVWTETERVPLLLSDIDCRRRHEEALEREVAELRTKLAEAKMETLRSSEAMKRMVRDEIEQLASFGKLNQFLLFLHDKQWINAIKLYREVFHGGLKESKDRVEMIAGITQ